MRCAASKSWARMQHRRGEVLHSGIGEDDGVASLPETCGRTPHLPCELLRTGKKKEEEEEGEDEDEEEAWGLRPGPAGPKCLHTT